MPSERSKLVIEDMVKLCADVIIFCQNLSLPAAVLSQITGSVSSIGANFSEAQDASSKKDFVNKIYIAKKESAETKYWLDVVEQLCDQRPKINDLSIRVQGFTMMLQKIINTSKSINR